MNTKFLLLGILCCMLMGTPLYAQKMKKVEKKEMKQIKKINPPKAKVKKERIFPGIIDPITGEEIPPKQSGPPSERFAVVFPPSSLQYPNSNFYVLGEHLGENNQNEPPAIKIHGEGPAWRTVEVKVMRLDGASSLIQDWTPISNKISPEGYWGAAIEWGTASDEGKSVKLKVSVRDAANKSNVKTFYVGRD